MGRCSSTAHLRSMFFRSASGRMPLTRSLDQIFDVEIDQMHLHLPGFDLGQVKDVVDQRQQVLPGRLDVR